MFLGRVGMGKAYLSPTQIDSYCRCGEAYRRRYYEGDIIPPGIALMQGSAFHRTVAINFERKIESHCDLTSSEMQAIAASEWDLAIAGGYQLTEEETARGTATVLGEGLDATVEMVGFHAHSQAPDYQPVMVEECVRIELPMAPRDLLGVIDLADDQGRVIDFKTSGRRKSQADADTSIQLTTYAALYMARTGDEPTELRLDTIVRGKKSIDRDVITTDRQPADYDALARRINAVSAAIDLGAFPPATPGAWWCGPKWCGYWNTCPYVNSERRAAAEGNGS